MDEDMLLNEFKIAARFLKLVEKQNNNRSQTLTRSTNNLIGMKGIVLYYIKNFSWFLYKSACIVCISSKISRHFCINLYLKYLKYRFRNVDDKVNFFQVSSALIIKLKCLWILMTLDGSWLPTVKISSIVETKICL